MTSPTHLILIVDDSAVDRAIYRNYLACDSRHHYHFIEASSGEQAIAIYQQQRPDLVLLDYQMPGQNGLVTLQQMRLLATATQLPVVMLTGDDSTEIAVEAMKGGTQDYLIKGKVTATAVQRAVHNLLEYRELQLKLERQQELQQLLASITLQVRQSLQLKMVLDTLVAQVRQCLATDRVIVYQFDQNWEGSIVAESVIAPWKSCLDLTLKDPCFQAQKGGIYKSGQSRVIADIYNDNLSDCHINMLEQFQVRANIVVPILVCPTPIERDQAIPPIATLKGGNQFGQSPKLWGLLIAHYCSSPHNWQDWEIELLEQLSVQAAIAIQQAELYQNLQQLNADLEARVEERTRALTASEAQFRAIVEQAAVGIERVDLEGNFLQVNRRFCEMLGYAEPEFMQLTIQDITYPEDWESHWQLMQELNSGQISTYSYEKRLVCKNKRTIWINLTASLICDEHGIPLSGLGIVEDINDRKQAEWEQQQAEKALRQSEAKNRAILQALPDLLLRMTKDGQYLEFCNLNGEETNNFSHITQSPNTVGDILPDYLATQRLHYVQLALETNEPQVYEHQVESCGEMRHEEIRIAVSGADEVLVIVRDITERHKMEAALRQLNQDLELRVAQRTKELQDSNQNLTAEIIQRQKVEEALRQKSAEFETIFNAIPDAVVFTDGNHTMRLVNPAFTNLFGYPAEEVLGKSTQILYQNREEFQQQIQLSVAPETFAKAQVCEISYVHKHGVLVITETVSTPVQDATGNLMGYLSIMRDILDRKASELEITRNRDLREAIFNESTDAIFLVNPDTLFTIDCNQLAVEMFEAGSKNQLIGIKGTSFQKENFSIEEIQDIWEEIRQNSFSIREIQYVTLQGFEFWGSLAIKPLNIAGQMINLFRVTDITRHKQAEEEMRKALQKEKDLNELKSRFISTTSHEFRTPLSVISSSAAILNAYHDRLSIEKREKHLNIIQTYVKHTTELLDDVLLINRAEAGQLAFTPAPLNPIEFCQVLIQEMQLSHEKSLIIFKFYSELQLPSPEEIRLSLDQKLIRQILSNLLSNAIKYSPDEETVNCELWLKPDSIILQVKDQGIGIPLEDQESLFESFYRARNVGTIQGTGLGLSIVKKCVELHGGNIKVASQLNQGTTFTVTIPIVNE